MTVLDGNNPDNLAGIRSEDLDGIKDFIAELPGSMHGAEDVLPEFYGSPLGLQEWPIDFVFDEITIWGGSALVAKLKPATDQSRQTLARLQVERKLFAERHPRFGLRPQSLMPQPSLAYFADPRLGNLAKIYLPDWSAAFAKRLGDIRLSFHTIGLHAFTDMATFFRLPER